MSWPHDIEAAGLPVANSTEPFWLSERSRLDRHRTTEDLPPNSDVIIVGSGLSGCICAYLLLRHQPNLRIIMLEAREACSGASARNGGQVKTDPYTTYKMRKAKFGAVLANELTTFETGHLARFEKLLAEEPIPCCFHVTSAFDVCKTEEMAKSARENFHARKADWPEDTAKLRELDDPEELQRLSGVKDGIWGCMYRVASIWPYKLATGLLERCFVMAKQGGGSFNLQTTTPVLSLESEDGHHILTTHRGTISAPKVAICTNGYMSNLLPEMRNKVVPIRGTCSSLLPATPQLPNTPSAKVFRPFFTSFALKFGGNHGEYMISRQEGRKEIILGGAKQAYIDDLPTWYGRIDDDELLPGAVDFFTQYLPKHFVNWPHPTSNVDRVWTGILGYSSDRYPWVGQHPTRPDGIFVMAGFHGHGMSRIFGCAEALVKLMLSEAKDSAGLEIMAQAGLPSPYFFTEQRLESRENVILEASGYRAPEMP